MPLWVIKLYMRFVVQLLDLPRRSAFGLCCPIDRRPTEAAFAYLGRRPDPLQFFGSVVAPDALMSPTQFTQVFKRGIVCMLNYHRTEQDPETRCAAYTRIAFLLIHRRWELDKRETKLCALAVLTPNLSVLWIARYTVSASWKACSLRCRSPWKINEDLLLEDRYFGGELALQRSSVVHTGCSLRHKNPAISASALTSPRSLPTPHICRCYLEDW